MGVGGLGGFLYGRKWADSENYEQYLTEFVSEDNMYHLLEKDKKPVFYYIYVPGEPTTFHFRFFFMKSAKKYNKYFFLFNLILFSLCHFMMINSA